MRADLIPAAPRSPRRARHLLPRDLPHRSQIVAALGVAVLLAHLLLAPVTLVLAACFHLVSRLSRWRPHWLLVPAATGLAWVATIGPAAALAGAAAGPRALAGLAAGLAGGLPRLEPLAAAAAAQRWLPGQLPLALIAGACEAAVAWWLGWLHTDEWELTPARPGLLVLARQRVSAARLRAGGVVTREGVCLGVERATGRPATVSWPEAAGGVLVTGGSWADVAATGFQFVHAAIRPRKPVIAVDLAGDPDFAASVTAACAAADAPLQVFSAAGPARYEPLHGGSPARRASLIAGVIDWTGAPDAALRDGTAVLTGICAVAAAAPPGPGAGVLDDVVRLLDPAALRARLAELPAYHPRLAALAGRGQAAAARLAADPDLGAMMTSQLTELRASVLGRWLGPGPAGGHAPRISLSAVARDHAVVLFSLGRAAYGRSAEMIATLVALDATAVFAGLRRSGAGGDGVAWFGQCEAADPAALAGLLASGPGAGLACVLCTTSPQAAGWLAGQAGVLAVHRLADPGLAGLIAPLTGSRLGRPGMPAGAAGTAGLPAALGAAPAPATGQSPAAGQGSAAGYGPVAPAAPAAAGTTPVMPLPPGLAWQPLVPPQQLCALPGDDFALIAGPPQERVSALARSVAVRIPEPRPVRAARLARLSGQQPAVRPPASWPAGLPLRAAPAGLARAVSGWVAGRGQPS